MTRLDYLREKRRSVAPRDLKKKQIENPGSFMDFVKDFNWNINLIRARGDIV